MEAPQAEGSPQEEGGAWLWWESLPAPLSYLVTTTLDYFWSFVNPPLGSWSPAQIASPSSPPAAQAQAMQENEPLNEENPQINEQLQEAETEKTEWVKVLKGRAAAPAGSRAGPGRGGESAPGARAAKKPRWGLLWFKRGLSVQVRVTGKTGGCENQFLKKVSDHLSTQRIRLKPERYREDSGHFLLVFCPVATSVGSDMANALEGLGSEPKAVLVMLHHKLKEITSPVDTRKRAHHPAVVRTLHARYTLEDGFYACQMNKEAVATVAEALKNHFKGS
nr:PREDICTED: uncharacterized protein LOC103281672 [Anolis carolinensis]|eukprot:XP_008121923.1 PREDICTED: uncharacterized protein LOC103281672 [Anolis carolinensis]